MRTLSTAMTEAQESFNPFPFYKILAYDPTLDTISEIVTGTSTQTPLDVTEYCTNVSWEISKISFTLADSDGIFHPDTGSMRAYFKDGAIIRLVEGDERVSESDWMVMFTGQIHGQIGWKISRQQMVLESRISVYSRENSQLYQRRKITTSEYTIGTDIGICLMEICTSFLGLTSEEIRIPTVLGYQFMHITNQLSQVTPWEGIQALLQTVGMVPFFDGEGKLAAFNKNMGRPYSRVYDDLTNIYDYEIPENVGDGINKVRIVFLSANLSKVTGQVQVLGTAQITTGFFTGREELDCWWSDDRKQRAENTYMVTLKGINDNLIPFIGTEEYTEMTEFHGTIVITISIWVPILATVMLAAYVGLSLIPDAWSGQFFGFTIPYGRVLQAIDLIGILALMMSLGSAQYEIWGTPYDYVYREMEAIAVEQGLSYWEENELKIENAFLGGYDQADIIAVTELIWEKCKNYTRRLRVRNDLSLEVGDIIVIPDGRKFVIINMSKTIKKGEVPALTLDCYKVMTV